jgi:PBP1b-binding outer membrane lipoprotein LpoB
MKSFIIMAAAAIMLSACSQNLPDPVTPIVIQREPLDRPTLNLPAVDKISAQPVDWTIVTPENIDEIFAGQAAQGEALVLFTVTATGYENISINTQEALRVIVQQQAVIDGYQVYYIRADGTIADFNADT